MAWKWVVKDRGTMGVQREEGVIRMNQTEAIGATNTFSVARLQ
jgi:hypothetical protein